MYFEIQCIFLSSENTFLANNEERWLFNPETHIQRQAMRHDCLHSFLGDEDKWSEIMCGAVRKKTFCTRLTRAAKAGQTSLVHTRRAQRTNRGRTPYICTPWVPICLSFNSQQGPPPLWFKHWSKMPKTLHRLSSVTDTQYMKIKYCQQAITRIHIQWLLSIWICTVEKYETLIKIVRY
jgi:hypothetical protein